MANLLQRNCSDSASVPTFRGLSAESRNPATSLDPAVKPREVGNGRVCRLKQCFAYTAFIFFLLYVNQPSFALKSDKTQILTFRADTADISQESHLGHYTGNVALDQGTTHLRAANATTEMNLTNQLIKAVAMGNPREQAHFWTLMDEKKAPFHAYADVIRYFPEKHLIELEGKARVEQGSDSFAAPMIQYDTLHQHVMSQSKGKSQTVIIIHPENHHE